MKEIKNNTIDRTSNYSPYSEKALMQELICKGLLVREKITDDEYEDLKNDKSVYLHIASDGTKYRLIPNESTNLNILSKIYSDIYFFKILAIIGIICSVLSPIITKLL